MFYLSQVFKYNIQSNNSESSPKKYLDQLSSVHPPKSWSKFTTKDGKTLVASCVAMCTEAFKNFKQRLANVPKPTNIKKSMLCFIGSHLCVYLIPFSMYIPPKIISTSQPRPFLMQNAKISEKLKIIIEICFIVGIG